MRILSSVPALVMSMTCSLSANLLTVNPSFESSTGFVGGENPFVDSSAIAGWRLTGVGNGGGFSQLLGVTGDPATGKDGNNFAYNVRGIFETVDSARPVIVPGLAYTFAFIAEADFDNIATSGAFSIDWYTSNSGYSPLSSTTEIINIAEAGEFQSFSLTGVAPLGATFAGVRYDTTIAAVGGSGANAWFDNASLTAAAVPEPTSLAAAAFGLVGLLARRRQRVVMN